MSSVEFEGEQSSHGNTSYTSRAIFSTPVAPKMARMLVKMNIVKNDRQAAYLLMIFSIIFLGLSAFVALNAYGFNLFSVVTKSKSAETAPYVKKVMEIRLNNTNQP